MFNVQQLQSRISTLRNELSGVEQACSQLSQGEQSHQQELQRMTQLEGNTSQQLQRISQTCQRINQELSQIANLSQQMASQAQTMYGGGQYTGFTGQPGQGQFGTTFGFVGQGQQPGQFGGGFSNMTGAATTQRVGQSGQWQPGGGVGNIISTTTAQRGNQPSQFGQGQFGQSFGQSLGTYGIGSAQTSTWGQQSQTQPYQQYNL